MSRRPTIAEIASEAGVSLPTVSRVLNQRPDVAPQTRERVIAVLKARGYQKKPLDEGPKDPRTPLIDLVISGWLDSEFYMELVRGIEEIFHPAGARLVLTTMHRNTHFAQRWLEQLQASSTQGVIFLDGAQQATFEKVRTLHIPFVAIDDNIPGSLKVPSVGANNWTSGLNATEYLLSLGHRRIAMITGPTTHLVSKGRVAGYRTALETSALPLRAEYIRESDFSMERGYSEARVLLDLLHPPTAIIASSDAQALGIYRLLHERDLRIPDDISIIGFDDIPMAQWMPPPLTTIRQPLRDLGQIAAERLLLLLDGKPLESLRVELASHLFIRASCAKPRNAE